MIHQSPYVIGKPIPRQRIRTSRPAAAAQIGSDHAVTRTQWRNNGQARTVIASSPMKHDDDRTATVFNGVKLDAITVIPEFLHHDLLAHVDARESCQKRKTPRQATRGLLSFDFRFLILEDYVPSSQEAR
jgi:hypothetical protein